MHRPPRAQRSYTDLKTMATSRSCCALLNGQQNYHRNITIEDVFWFIHVLVVLFFIFQPIEWKFPQQHLRPCFCSSPLPSISLQLVRQELTFITKWEGMAAFSWQVIIDPFRCAVKLRSAKLWGWSSYVVHPSRSGELRGRSPADQSNIRLKGRLNSDSDSIRGEQPGSETNKSVCQDWTRSVGSCLPLIAPSATLSF